MIRVTIEDLLWAADWLESYEDVDGVPAGVSDSKDETVLIAQRVAKWLEAEVQQRLAKAERAKRRRINAGV